MKRTKFSMSKVIKGPWPDSGIKVSDVDGVRLIEELAFADHLTEGIMVQLIQTMKENGIDVAEQEFLADIGFLIETVKGVIYRSLGHKHPLQNIMNNVIQVNEMKDDEEMKFDTVFDMELVENMNDFITAKLEDDDGPEISLTIFSIYTRNIRTTEIS